MLYIHKTAKLHDVTSKTEFIKEHNNKITKFYNLQNLQVILNNIKLRSFHFSSQRRLYKQGFNSGHSISFVCELCFSCKWGDEQIYLYASIVMHELLKNSEQINEVLHKLKATSNLQKQLTFFWKYNKINILFEKSCT